jgi:hypothetical protein
MDAKAIMNATVTSNDQATGLRTLFGGLSSLPVHVLACPVRPAWVLPLMHQVSVDLSSMGHTVLSVDELSMTLREDWPLPPRMRFDLAQALEGHVALSQAVSALTPSAWVALSQKTSTLAGKVTPLADRLAQSGVNFGSVLVASALKSGSLPHYANQLHQTLITPCDKASLEASLRWIIESEATHPAKSWGVVLLGKGAKADEAWRWLEAAALESLHGPMERLGQYEHKWQGEPLTKAWRGHLELMDHIMHHALVA